MCIYEGVNLPHLDRKSITKAYGEAMAIYDHNKDKASLTG